MSRIPESRIPESRIPESRIPESRIPESASPEAPLLEWPSPTADVSDRTAALPVELDLHGRHAAAVRAWVEGTLGWQHVAGATAGLVPPAVVLRDLGIAAHPAGVALSGAAGASAAVSRGEVAGVRGSVGRTVAVGASAPPTGVPCILLVDDDASPLHAARRVAVLGPDAVVAWPSGRDELAPVAAAVLDRPRHRQVLGSSLRVGGSAGGVGTTTVTLALAGLAAWRGAPTLAAVRGTGLAPRPVPTAALAGIGIWARADAVPGVAGCRAVRLVDHDPIPDPTDPAIGMLLVDAGVDPEVDVLVCRPDAAGLEALATTTAAAIVIVGDGPAPDRAVRRAAVGRQGIALPWSARVARAGLAGRVPAGLPGAWLKRLVPLLPDEVGGA